MPGLALFIDDPWSVFVSLTAFTFAIPSMPGLVLIIDDPWRMHLVQINLAHSPIVRPQPEPLQVR